MNFEIDKRRGIIAGLATIFILIFHSYFEYTPGTLPYFTKNFFDVGVDIFLVISGYGLYHSLQKGGILQFYKKRALRVLLPYLPVAIVWYAIIDFITNKNGIIKYIKDVTTMSYWLEGNISSWFVSAILLFYLLSPIIYKLLPNKVIYGGVSILFIFIIAFLIDLCIWLVNDKYIYLSLSVQRFPAFFTGMLWGKHQQFAEKYKKNGWVLIGIVIFLGLGIMVSSLALIHKIPYWIKYVGYLPISIVICMLPFEKCNIKFIRPVKKLGKYSFECYLLFEKVLVVLSRIGISGQYVISIFGGTLTLFTAFLYKMILVFVLKHRVNQKQLFHSYSK